MALACPLHPGFRHHQHNAPAPVAGFAQRMCLLYFLQRKTWPDDRADMPFDD